MSTTRKIAVYVAFFLITATFLLIAFAVVWFWWPADFSMWGFGGVRVQNQFTKFFGSEIEDMMEHRRFVINSGGTNVQIRVTNPGYYSETSIVLWEDARGLSFNGVNRSGIQWTQVLLPSGDAYYQINVVQPQGSVSRNALLTINLPSDRLPAVEIPQYQPYYFIFNTSGGNVEFVADPGAEVMLVGGMTINGWGQFTFPPPPPSPYVANQFRMDIRQLTVNSSARVTAMAGIAGDVVINSHSGTFNFGDVGSQSDSDYVLRVTNGSAINVNTATVWGNVYYRSLAGSLNIRGTAANSLMGNLFMRTSSAGANITAIGGNVTVGAETTVVGGDVNIVSTGSSSFSLTEVRGELRATMNQGSLTVPTLGSVGEEAIIQSTRASITLGTGTAARGVLSHVNINNRYGPTRVTFSNNIEDGAPSVYIRGRDGIINVSNIIGQTFIGIELGGRGTILAEFREIAASTTSENIIEHLGVTLADTTHGNITVRLQTVDASFMAFHLKVRYSRNPRDFTGWNVGVNTGDRIHGVRIPLYNEDGTIWQVHGGDPDNTQDSSNHLLQVRTGNTFRLERT